MRRLLDFVVLVVVLPGLTFGIQPLGDRGVEWEVLVTSPLIVIAGPLLFFLGVQAIWLIAARLINAPIDSVGRLVAARTTNALFVSYAGMWVMFGANASHAYIGSKLMLPMIAFSALYGVCTPWHRWVRREREVA